METKTIIENDNLSTWLDYLKNNGYKYIVKAQDEFLSGWGNATNKKHIQLIAVKDETERDRTLGVLYRRGDQKHINWWKITETTHIYNAISNGKTYTIRNDRWM